MSIVKDLENLGEDVMANSVRDTAARIDRVGHEAGLPAAVIEGAKVHVLFDAVKPRSI